MTEADEQFVSIPLSEFEALARPPRERDRLFVNAERTVLVRLWASGNVEVATRETPAHIWGPPVYLTEEK